MKLVTVGRYFNPTDAHLASNLLNNASIKNFVQHESIAGFFGVAISGNSGQILLQVAEDQAEEALEVLQQNIAE